MAGGMGRPVGQVQGQLVSMEGGQDMGAAVVTVLLGAVSLMRSVVQPMDRRQRLWTWVAVVAMGILRMWAALEVVQFD